MEIYTNPVALQAQCLKWRGDGLRVGFVPTMGALHEGHLSLVTAARQDCDKVVTSVFVNPLQFGPGEDLDSYPQTPERDQAQLDESGVDALFLPQIETLYPHGHQTRVTVNAVSHGLCGAHRPGHFNGVTTVVATLFQIVQPHAAFFGKKDYQQWRVVERMTRDLFIPVEVRGLPIVREPDGLAMSSRNAYLNPDQRLRAVGLSRALHAVKARFLEGERGAATLEQTAREVLEEVMDKVDYVELRDAESLHRQSSVEGPSVMLVAAYVGKTRLIDNLEIGFNPPREKH